MTKNGSAAAVVAGYMRIVPSMMSPVLWSCVLGAYSKYNLILTDSYIHHTISIVNVAETSIENIQLYTKQCSILQLIGTSI